MSDAFDDAFGIDMQRRARNANPDTFEDEHEMQAAGTQGTTQSASAAVSHNEPIDAEAKEEERQLQTRLGRRRLSFTSKGGATTTAVVQFNSFVAPPANDDVESSKEGEEDDNRSVTDMIQNVSFTFRPQFVQMPAEDTADKDNSTVSIVYKDVCVSAGDKQLLFDVTGEISSGLIAIMGPSGSGKTTLMNCLAARMDGNMSLSGGAVRINGAEITKASVKPLIGYVMQDDVLLENLSVRSTLQYACSLRFGHRFTPEEQAARIATVVDMMSLEACLDLPVSNSLSGGERKRIAVALELLSFPKVLFLDEPTSSLDSVDALNVVRCLRKLVDDFHLTIVCTIHQPQYKVFTTFDRLILLSAGRLLFDAAISRAVDFCAAVRMPVLPGVNPADQIMYVATRYASDIQSMNPEVHHSRVIDLSLGRHRTGVVPREMSPRWHQFKVLFSRNANLFWQRRTMIIVNIIQTIVNAILIGFAFRPNISLEAKLQGQRLSVIAYCCLNQGNFGAISALSAFGAERVICLRERAAGLYHAFPYFAAKVCFEYLSRAVFPMLFSLICFWVLGLSVQAADFFYFLFIMWAANVAAVALAMSVSTLARVNEVACIILPLLMEVSRLFNSFFVAPVDANVGLKWIHYLSYVNYAYKSLVIQQGEGITYTCPLVNGSKVACAPYATGRIQYQTLQLDDMPYGGQVGVLFLYVVVCLTLAYLGMRFLTK